MSETFEIEWSAKFDKTYLKPGSHTLLIPLAPEVYQLIGSIVAQWGHFEMLINDLIGQMHANIGKTPPEKWQRAPFKKRKELFRDITAEYCPKVGWDNEIDNFKRICATAADLHWRRNIVAHGLYQPIPSKDGKADWIATGAHKGKNVSLKVDDKTLRQLFHDLAHLNGDLKMILISRGVNFSIVTTILHDTFFLQGSQDDSPYPRPIPTTHLPLPQSPQG